jgi:hypothetical protein
MEHEEDLIQKKTEICHDKHAKHNNTWVGKNI